MSVPQSGIFALGTASRAYLEFEAGSHEAARQLVSAIASLREPRTTMGGVNLVAGFRPELWSEVAPDDSPSGVHGFNTELAGADGNVMPATQHDAVLWLSGSAYDVIFDTAREAISEMSDICNYRRGILELAVSTRPRPHGLHRRQRESDAHRCAPGR